MTFSAPKWLLHAEGLAVLVSAGVVYARLDGSWSLFALLFFAPDLAMIGYAAGPKTGATFYNAAHTYLAPLAVAGFAQFADRETPLCVALIWAAHIGFDRLLGYGLKYPSNFQDTHFRRPKCVSWKLLGYFRP